MANRSGLRLGRERGLLFSVERCGCPDVLTTVVTVPQANYGQHKHKDVEHLFAFIVRTATVRADSPLRFAATPQASGLKAPNTDEEAPR